jgi:hypothetical protein
MNEIEEIVLGKNRKNEMYSDKMKNWIYFYIEYTIKYSEPFYKESGWSLALKNNYVVVSTI